MYRLVLRNSTGDEIHKHALKTSDEVSIGRGSDNDVVLGWEGVSRRHALARMQSGELWIEDCGSKNGLLLEDRRLGRFQLRPGVPVQIGDGFLSLEEVDTTDAEMAIEFSLPEQASGYRPFSGLANQETKTVDAPGCSPERALEWLAKHGGEVHRSGWIQAASLLGAEGISILKRDASGSARLEMCIGRFDEGVFKAIEDSTSVDRQPSPFAVKAVGSRPASVASDSAFVASDRVLVARLAPGTVLEPWQQSFFQCLAQKAGTDWQKPPQAASTEQAHSPSSDGLKLPPEMILGPSEAMRELMATMQGICRIDSPILIEGPTGCGKELVARCLHLNGSYSKGPFIPVQCTEIPQELIEAELFGIVGKAATGVASRKGRIEKANGGTLFLDEIAELPGNLQVKLLRALQAREVWPIGADKARSVQLQILSATHVDLGQAVDQGRFREDLYFRLAGFRLSVPSLDQRREDIPELVSFFVRQTANGKKIAGISRRALTILQEHPWRGNIRQLRQAVEVAVGLARDGESLEEVHLRYLGESRSPNLELDEHPARLDDHRGSAEAIRPLQASMEEHERRVIRRALRFFRGNKSKTADALGISRPGLRSKMKRLFLD